MRVRNTAKDEAADAREKLIEQAERTGKWLYARYPGIWFSPAQLRAENAAGKFRWSADSFESRDPAERVREADEKVEAAMREAQRIRAEVGM